MAVPLNGYESPAIVPGFFVSSVNLKRRHRRAERLFSAALGDQRQRFGSRLPFRRAWCSALGSFVPLSPAAVRPIGEALDASKEEVLDASKDEAHGANDRRFSWQFEGVRRLPVIR